MSNGALMKQEESADTMLEELTQLFSLMLSKEEYGVEVFIGARDHSPAHYYPNAQHSTPYVEGIINLRGKVIPIISMRKRFGLPESDYTSHTRIMVMDVPDGLTGFIVDEVSEVMRIRSNEIQPPPMISGNLDQEFIMGVFNHADQLLITMDIDRMFTPAEQQEVRSLPDSYKNYR